MITLLSILLLHLTLAPPAQQRAVRPPVLPPAAIARAGWLLGCWRSTDRRIADVREHWRRASDDVLVATTFTTLPGRPPEHVFLRMESAGDGGLTLVMQSGGRPPTRLGLEASPSVGELSFAQAGAGASARVGYRRGAKADTLVTWIEAGDGSARVDTPMKKVGCD